VSADTHPSRWRMLALLATAELFGMSLWFAANAVAAMLRAEWQLSGSEVAWLTTVVQLGFVAGTAVSALLNLADVVPARWLFAASAVLGALANAALLTAAHYELALVTRFATGFFLAGVYPPAMKMAATWFRARRGLAVGTVVGALTVGKGVPYLVHAVPGAGVSGVVLTTSAAALLAALLVFGVYHDGPYHFPPRRFSMKFRSGARNGIGIAAMWSNRAISASSSPIASSSSGRSRASSGPTMLVAAIE